MIIVGGAQVFVEMDFTGTAFGSSPTWTDVTADCITSPQTEGSSEITGSWGRQDWLGDVTAGSLSITLINVAGKYTPQNAASPYYPHVKYGVRCQVRFVISGVTVYVAGGFATDWTATPANGSYWTTQVNFTDIYGLFSNSTELRGYLTEECFLDSPSWLYQLQEDEGSTSFGDITGQQQPALIVNSKYGAGTLDAGQTPAGNFAAGNVVTFTSPSTGALISTSLGSWLSLPNPITSGPWTIEGYFAVTGSGEQALWSACGPTSILGTFNTALLRVGGLSGVGVTLVDNAGTSVTVNTSTTITDGSQHQVAVSLASDHKTVTLTVDGVATSNVGSTSFGAFNLGPLTIGMQVIGSAALNFPLTGSAAFISAYPTALTSTRLTPHYDAAAFAFAGIDRTDQHVARLLSYRASYGSVLDVGLGLVGSEDINGETMQTALSDTSSAEGGVLYADGQQRIVLRSRAVTFNPTPVVTADISQGQMDVPTTFRDDVQNVVNDITVSRPNGADQRAFNTTSISQVGDYTQSITANVDTDQHALDLANWLVAQGTLDQTASPTLTFNLYALLARGSTALVLALLQLRPLDVVKTTNNLPQAPSSTMQMVVQGGSFTISSEAISLELYTTPMPSPVAVWDVTKWDDSNVWAY